MSMEIIDKIDINNLPEAYNKEQNNYYFRLLNTGQLDLEELLIIHNLKLIIKVIRKMDMKYHILLFTDIEELFNIGIIALISSIRNFDVTKNFAFSSYSFTSIYRDIYVYIKKQIDYNNGIYENNRMEYENFEVWDILPATNVDIEKECIRNEEIRHLYKAIDNLNDNEKQIILLYFIHGLKYNEISLLTGFNKEYICKNIKSAKKKIKTFFLKNGYTISNEKQKPISSCSINSSNTTIINIQLKRLYNNYTEQQILKVIKKLPEEDQNLLTARFPFNSSNINTLDVVKLSFNYPTTILKKRLQLILKDIEILLNNFYNNEYAKRYFIK